MLNTNNLAGFSIDVLDDLSNWDESLLVEYINQIAVELWETRSQQIQLDRHVEQLSGTVASLVKRVGSLTHCQDQLDAKVCALFQDVKETQSLSRQALNTANTASDDVKQLREEAFRMIDERLAVLGRRVDEFVANV